MKLEVRNEYDGGLTAGIEGKELVIRVGVGRLAWCLEHDDGPLHGCKVKPRAFVKDMLFEMERDDDTGQTPTSKFMEDMAKEAYDMGSVNIKIKDDDEE